MLFAVLNNKKKTFLDLKDTNLKTARAYRIKLAPQKIWAKSSWLAPIYFEEWYMPLSISWISPWSFMG